MEKRDAGHHGKEPASWIRIVPLEPMRVEERELRGGFPRPIRDSCTTTFIRCVPLEDHSIVLASIKLVMTSSAGTGR